MYRFKSGKGSLTVEAAITLPVFICVIVSIAFIIKVVYVHELIQHAVSETADELASYSYIYSVSGLQKLHDETVEGLDAQKERVSRQAGTLIDCAESLKGISGDVSDNAGDIAEDIQDNETGQALEDLKELRQSVEELKQKYEDTKAVFKEIKDDPKGELKSLVCVFARAGMEEAKTELVLKPLAKVFLVKYLKSGSVDEADKKLRALNIVDGFEGLDFSRSKLLEDKKHIDLIVRYKVKPSLPIKILPELCFEQRARVRAWLDGDGDLSDIDNTDDIWALANLQRGKRIQDMYGRNLPDNFKTITKYENGTATLVTSINLRAKTYQENNQAAAKRIEQDINDLAGFEHDSKTADENGRTIEYYVDAKYITKKKLIVVVPKGSGTGNFPAILEQCRRKAESKEIMMTVEEL